MRTVYIDTEFKCHLSNDGMMTEVETDFFDGKCPEYIEGFRFVPSGAVWVRSDGVSFKGEMISPWKPFVELEGVQRAYERQLLAEYEALINELYLEVTA